MRPGFLYVLTHPSKKNFYKVGVTVLHPEERLRQHNSNFGAYAGRVVRETGQKWELKTYIEVADPYWAESVFWSKTPFPLLPGGVTVEIYEMDWEMIQCGLDAASSAGLRPKPKKQSKEVRDKGWLEKRLTDSGISLTGDYRGLISKTDFQCIHGHKFTESAGVVAYKLICPLCEQQKVSVS